MDLTNRVDHLTRHCRLDDKRKRDPETLAALDATRGAWEDAYLLRP